MIAENTTQYPKDALQQKLLQTFFPYINTRKFHQLEIYGNQAVSELLDGVETFLRKEKIAIPYDDSLPPVEIPDNFSSLVGLATFRLNKAPELHNQPPLAQYYVNNMPFQRNLANLMFALANYCEQVGTGDHVDMKDEDIQADIGLNRASPSDPKGFEKLSKAEYPDFSKPVIFGLGGLATQEKGDVSIIQDNFEKLQFLASEQDADQYLVTYPAKPMVLYCAYGSQYNQNPEHYYSEAAMQFTQDVLLPAVSPEYTPIHPHARRFRDHFAQEPVISGERYADMEQVRERLGNIRFVSHSYGSCFVQEVRNALVRSMKDLGYSPEEIHSALPAVFSLNTATLVQTDIVKKEGDFSQFNMVLEADIVANNCADHVRQMNGVPKGNVYTLTAPHTNAVNYSNHAMQGELYAAPGEELPFVKQRSAHEWELYLRDGYDKSGTYHANSELPASVLKNAINRGAAIAGTLKTLFNEEIHDTQAVSNLAARDRKQSGATIAR